MVHDLQDGNGRHSHASVRKDRKSAGHFQHADVTAAQRKRKAIIIAVQRCDPEAFCHGDHALVAVHADELQGFHGRDVERIRERRAHRHRAVELIIVIIGYVRWVGIVRVARRRELRRHIPDERSGCPAFFEGCHVVDRFDRRPGLPRLADRHVDLS